MGDLVFASKIGTTDTAKLLQPSNFNLLEAQSLQGGNHHVHSKGSQQLVLRVKKGKCLKHFNNVENNSNQTKHFQILQV